jgi:hypothetical protein
MQEATQSGASDTYGSVLGWEGVSAENQNIRSIALHICGIKQSTMVPLKYAAAVTARIKRRELLDGVMPCGPYV